MTSRAPLYRRAVCPEKSGLSFKLPGRSMLTRSVFTALALTLALASAGCEDEKKKTAAAAADAGASTQPLLDGKLGEAVAEAEAEATAKNKAAPAKGSAGDDGPPEKGVFETAA